MYTGTGFTKFSCFVFLLASTAWIFVRRPLAAIVAEQLRRQVEDVLGPDAAVAERAHPAGKAAAGVGVVQIDVVRIVHHELELAERVARARRLAPAHDLAVLLDRRRSPACRATSWVMLGGTSHDGLSITPSAITDSCGVGVLVAPAIALCFQRLTPFSTSVAWKPGTLTMMYFSPRSRGSQRQRSRLSRIRLIFAASVGGGRRERDLQRAHIADGSAAGREARRRHACWASADAKQSICLRRVEVVVDDVPGGSLRPLDVAEREVGRHPVEPVAGAPPTSGPGRPTRIAAISPSGS